MRCHFRLECLLKNMEVMSRQGRKQSSIWHTTKLHLNDEEAGRVFTAQKSGPLHQEHPSRVLKAQSSPPWRCDGHVRREKPCSAGLLEHIAALWQEGGEDCECAGGLVRCTEPSQCYFQDDTTGGAIWGADSAVSPSIESLIFVSSSSTPLATSNIFQPCCSHFFLPSRCVFFFLTHLAHPAQRAPARHAPGLP